MIRERIANWLTGGELDRLRKERDKLLKTQTGLTFKVSNLQDSLNKECKIVDDLAALKRKQEAETTLQIAHLRSQIEAIYRGTKDVKHGTARKVARMCKEALE